MSAPAELFDLPWSAPVPSRAERSPWRYAPPRPDPLDAIASGLYVFNLRTRAFDYVNAAMATLSGCTREELLAAPLSWIDRVHPEDRRFFIAAARRVVTAGAVELAYRYCRPDGTVVTLNQSARRIHHGRFPGAIEGWVELQA